MRETVFVCKCGLICVCVCVCVCVFVCALWGETLKKGFCSKSLKAPGYVAVARLLSLTDLGPQISVIGRQLLLSVVNAEENSMATEGQAPICFLNS